MMASKLGTIIIGGGTGFIGSALKTTLRDRGYRVIIVSRKPKTLENQRDHTITWEELNSNGLPGDVTGVVNVAGQNVLDPTRHWTPGFKQNVWASRVNTTRYLADAKEKAQIKPKVFVTISGVAYYPPSHTQEYTEDSKGGDFDFLSSLCTDWEAASKINTNTLVRTVNIRSGVVLGREGGMISQLIMPFYFGLGGPVGSGKQPMPWIHIDDIVGLFVHAIENSNVDGVVNGVAPHVITNKEFAKTIGSTINRPTFFFLPTSFINWLFSEERAKIMTEGQKVLPKKALDTGYVYEYPNIHVAAEEFSRFFIY